MARMNRQAQATADEVIGYLNIFAVSRKTGAKKKVAWQQVTEGDDLAKIGPQLQGTFTSETGVQIEIQWNALSEEEFEL